MYRYLRLHARRPRTPGQIGRAGHCPPDGDHLTKVLRYQLSEDIQTLLIRDLKTDFPMLVDFLQRRFDGGTDVRPAFPKPDDAAHPRLASF